MACIQIPCFILFLLIILQASETCNSRSRFSKETKVCQCTCVSEPCKCESQDMVDKYPGLFLDKDKLNYMKEKTIEQRCAGVKQCIAALNGDYDTCCPTYFEYRNFTTMTNLQGNEKHIIHLNLYTPPLWQWIPHGTCGTPGTCVGKCRQEYTILCLLVVETPPDAVPYVSFDWFEVPSYCSCKTGVI